ncbi:MAG: phytoene desaturase family protein [Promethearchaeota archaeon]
MIVEESEDYKVVIIGAGNGGLVAAARLALAGIKVLLIEQHNLPGGFASSFVRGRFEFETSLHEMADFGSVSDPGGIRVLFDKLGVDAEFLEVPEAYRIITKDLDVTMPFGIENFLNAIEEQVPGCRESVENFFKIAEDISVAFAYIGSSKGNPEEKVLIKEHSNFLKTASYSSLEVEEALGIPEKARNILNAYWAYLGLPISRINFTLFAAMINTYIKRGAYIPRYRSTEFTVALDKRIRELGGEIMYNTRVEKILVENGKVIGLETSNGDKIKTNYVISNASQTLVYNKLIHPKSEVPEIAYKEVNSRIHGLSAFVVYLGLDASAEELGLNEYSYFIMDDMNTENLYNQWNELRVPKGQATVCLNVAIPDCSPPGTSILYFTTLFKPEVWKDVKPEDYVDVKNRIANGLITDFENALGISIREHIEEIEVATPETFARYTRTYNGIIYGYEPESWDSLVPRLMMMGDHNYIKGLEFAGGFGRRCHGYSSALKDGEIAALLVLNELSVKVRVQNDGR